MCDRKRKLRNKIYYFNKGHRRCHYCCTQLNYKSGHKNSATVEHIVPKSEGGTLAIVNCLIICYSCNEKRANKDFISFVAGSQFPRQEWLRNKLKEALKHKERISNGN